MLNRPGVLPRFWIGGILEGKYNTSRNDGKLFAHSWQLLIKEKSRIKTESTLSIMK